MSWLKKIFPERIRTEVKNNKKTIPDGVWEKCSECDAMLYRPELERNLMVCPQCDHHMRMGARKRLTSFFDEGSMQELGEDILPKDALNFKDVKPYKDRLSAAQKKTGEKDALIVASGRINSLPLVAAAFEFAFLGGSMGSVVGERFMAGVNYALDHHVPFVCFTASGGARMQESLFSLMQMAKVSAGLARLKERKIPYIVVLTDPTTGGVSASLAMLGDIHIAEPKALIGFAGPRVIEQTVREKLPEGFQRSEFLLEKGMVDIIIARKELKDRLADILAKLLHKPKPVAPVNVQAGTQDDAASRETLA